MGLTFRDRAVIVGGTLVIADLHLGRERSADVELSLGSESAMRERLETLLADHNPRDVVVAGDALHSFDSLPPGVASAFEGLRESVADHGADLIITPGNHDVRLDAVWDGPTPDSYTLADGETVVLHGHEPPEPSAERYLIGHDHPAIEIEGRKRPCFLRGVGAYRGSDVVVLPSFNELVAGVRINGMRAADFHSPLIQNAGAFRPIVRDGNAAETLEFPPLGSFREML